jgi:hypothetical protein
MQFMSSPRIHLTLGLGLPCCVLIVLCWCSTRVGASEDDELHREFLDQYPQAVERLKKATWNLYYEARHSHDSKKYRIKAWFDAAAEFEKGNRAALNNKGSMAGESLRESPKGRLAAFVYCATPEYAFNLEKVEKNSPYLISYYGDDPYRIETYKLFATDYSNVAFAAFQLYDLPIDHVLKEPSFKIVSLKKLSRDGEDLIEIRFELLNSKLWYESGSWIVSPAEDWAVREYEVVMRSSEVDGVPWIDAGKITYKRIENRSVFPSTIEVTRSHSPQPGKERIHEKFITHIDKVTFDSVSAANFRLSAFGLPDIPVNGSWNRYLVILMFVGAALVFGIVYRHLESRRGA